MKIRRSSTSSSELSGSRLTSHSLTGFVFFTFVFLAVVLVIPRFFIFKSLCSRGLECASLYRKSTAPFRAQYFFSRKSICGDLVAMTNAPQSCFSRPEVFQTDRWGYRNDDRIFERPSDILIYGDSFAFGADMSQDAGPAAQISEVTGRSVYNGAGKLELNFLKWQLEHFKSPPKALVYFHLERHHLGKSELQEWDKKIPEGLSGDLATFWETFSRYNPLKILAGKLEKIWLIPEVFPNRFEENAPRYLLKNAAPFLFLKSSVDQYGDSRSKFLEGDADFFMGLQGILSAKGIKLIVVLVPEKFNVYAPLMVNPPKTIERGASYLEVLDLELKKKKIQSLDLLPLFKKAAADDLPRGEYIYFSDDTHWNPRGVRLMANELKKILTYF